MRTLQLFVALLSLLLAVHLFRVRHDVLFTTNRIQSSSSNDYHQLRDHHQRMNEDSSGSKEAVLHIGPPKTGTTTIQYASDIFRKKLKEDGFDMPWVVAGVTKQKNTNGRYEVLDRNQVNFAMCFIQSKRKELYICLKQLLTSGLEIANQNRNIFISTETFSRPDIDIHALSEYLKLWEKITVVVGYRRYYDWIMSAYNQNHKVKPGVDNLGLLSQKTSFYDFMLNDIEGVKAQETSHTYQVIQRYKQYFNNIVVLNIHDTSKELVEAFYCDAMQNAQKMCEEVKELEVESKNLSKPLSYVELLAAAHDAQLIYLESNREVDVALEKIEEHQESTLGLSIHDFPMKCLPPNMLAELLEKSLKFEKEVVPEFFASPLGEAALRSDFEEKSKGKMCSIDFEATLKTVEWLDFFMSLRQELEQDRLNSFS